MYQFKLQVYRNSVLDSKLFSKIESNILSKSFIPEYPEYCYWLVMSGYVSKMHQHICIQRVTVTLCFQ